jgi:hypothetical protein
MGAAILLALALAVPPESRLPFIADDYDHARAEAERRQLPLFVEVWAPW